MDDAIRAWIRRHKRGLRRALLVGGLLALLLVALAAWGIFRGVIGLKDLVKGSMDGQLPSIRLPLEWEKPLGDSALTQLRGQYTFLNDRQVLDPFERLAAPLVSAPAGTADRYTLYVTTSKEVNAFALPGGIIVFHRGLLERACSAAEIQGVLAHEMAHVQKRHGVLQLVKNLGLELAVKQLQGGESRMLDTLLRDSGQLMSLKFSRDAERSADDLGWELLEQAQINPQGMVDFFGGLMSDAGSGKAAAIPLLSTHPAPQERIDRLRQKLALLGSREFPSFEESFQDLQKALGVTAGK
jgi:predicted Zn-dependent protease